METIVFTIAIVFTIGFMTWREHLQAKVYEVREKKYLSMISDLQNRITAKDLSGYFSLVNEQRKAEEPAGSRFAPLDDAEEARIAAMKRGLVQQALEAS